MNNGPVGYDPNTGRPIYGYDPNTGAPIYEATPIGYDPDTGRPIYAKPQNSYTGANFGGQPYGAQNFAPHQPYAAQTQHYGAPAFSRPKTSLIKPFAAAMLVCFGLYALLGIISIFKGMGYISANASEQDLGALSAAAWLMMIGGVVAFAFLPFTFVGILTANQRVGSYSRSSENLASVGVFGSMAGRGLMVVGLVVACLSPRAGAIAQYLPADFIFIIVGVIGFNVWSHFALRKAAIAAISAAKGESASFSVPAGPLVLLVPRLAANVLFISALRGLDIASDLSAVSENYGDFSGYEIYRTASSGGTLSTISNVFGIIGYSIVVAALIFGFAKHVREKNRGVTVQTLGTSAPRGVVAAVIGFFTVMAITGAILFSRLTTALNYGMYGSEYSYASQYGYARAANPLSTFTTLEIITFFMFIVAAGGILISGMSKRAAFPGDYESPGVKAGVWVAYAGIVLSNLLSMIGYISILSIALTGVSYGPANVARPIVAIVTVFAVTYKVIFTAVFIMLVRPASERLAGRNTYCGLGAVGLSLLSFVPLIYLEIRLALTVGSLALDALTVIFMLCYIGAFAAIAISVGVWHSTWKKANDPYYAVKNDVRYSPPVNGGWR